ncbi:MAG TPA: plasmid stabilization protein [Methanocorpusculum sp.]|nr:plasmid stabilization protein [Methanocorpusculum sp.]HJJ49788.1 plasmid stabilization protein [Methanocorpusculum sp.]HJJ57374.1 plasmid stabilization protein [Methanocorpusculum sp.]
MTYNIRFTDKACDFLRAIPEKHKPAVLRKIRQCLGEYLKINTHQCNKKLLKGSSPERYRLHIGMTYTLFYLIDEDSQMVIVTNAMGINQAHNRYNRF